MSPGQLGAGRPDLASPVRNLFFAGHWVKPGGGITPVIVSAQHAAQAVAGAIARRERVSGAAPRTRPPAPPPRASGASAGTLGAASPPERWLFVGADDATSRRLAAWLGMTQETPEGSFPFPGAFAASVAAAPANAPGCWDAVAYRPPRRRGNPDLPDLAAAEAFLAGFGERCGGALTGDRCPRLVLISSAAAVSP